MCIPETEVPQGGLRADGTDQAVENWLQDQVGPAYDALKANPTRDQVRARIAAEHKTATAKI